MLGCDRPNQRVLHQSQCRKYAIVDIWSHGRNTKHSKSKLSDLNRLGFQDPPPTRVDTTERVRKLREKMAAAGVDVLIIPTDDDHQVM